MKIVVPMAGAGRRFSEAGFTVPKPLIDVAGRPMIERVLENLSVAGAQFILIVRSEHLQSHGERIRALQDAYDTHVISIDHLTEGQASTVFLAARLINTDESLVIANSDQIIDISLADYIADSDRRGLDGSILTFLCDDPKWSYAAVDDEGLVTCVAEKQAISRHATVGIYYWKQGRKFVTAAAEMMARGERVNNEFYAAPAYNYAIAAGKRFGIYEIEEKQMHGLGTPEDLQLYLRHYEKVSA